MSDQDLQRMDLLCIASSLEQAHYLPELVEQLREDEEADPDIYEIATLLNKCRGALGFIEINMDLRAAAKKFTSGRTVNESSENPNSDECINNKPEGA